MIRGVYEIRVTRGQEQIVRPVHNTITNEARLLIAAAMFDGAETPSSYQIGLIGVTHDQFGAPRKLTSESLGPPFLTANPIYNDIFALSGLNLTASAEYSDLGSSSLPTLDSTFPRQTWNHLDPGLDANGAFTVSGSDFITYNIPTGS